MKLLSLATVIVLLLNLTTETVIKKEDPHIILNEVEITDDSLSGMERKWCMFRDLGKELPITITPEKFADHCMIVYWCESNLNPKAISGTQEGFQQLTANTRKLLKIPKHITHLSFEQQIPFLKKYLLATKLIHKVKTSVDLHVLNFAPARFHKHRLSGYIKGLDRDGDKTITRNDLLLFEAKRYKSLRKVYP